MTVPSWNSVLSKGAASCKSSKKKVLGRAEARRKFTVEDLVAQTEGIECPKTDAVLDEIPSAYKNIDVVMENQKDLVEVVHVLRQVLNVKGA